MQDLCCAYACNRQGRPKCHITRIDPPFWYLTQTHPDIENEQEKNTDLLGAAAAVGSVNAAMHFLSKGGRPLGREEDTSFGYSINAAASTGKLDVLHLSVQEVDEEVREICSTSHQPDDPNVKRRMRVHLIFSMALTRALDYGSVESAVFLGVHAEQIPSSIDGELST
jgi:hypothetical protein